MQHCKDARGMFYSEIAVHELSSLQLVFTATGTVEPTGNCSNGLTDFEAFTVLQSILHQPKVEVRQELFHIIGRWVQNPTQLARRQ